MKLCAVIPSRNHYLALPGIVARLRQDNIAVFIVDDGSSCPAREAIAALHDPENAVEVQRTEQSRGKGAAVTTAMQTAIARGFTHALQIDADGQHDLSALPHIIAAAEKYPDALICGHPVYDASAPMGRRIGRWITHFWVWVETLSFRIVDSMCGFRLYPLKACADLFAHTLPKPGMEFDTDIIVRLFWRGVAPVWLAVQVRYPPGNTSNFDVWRDNVRISMMHTRLFFSMLGHLPVILTHRPPRPEKAGHWARIPERGVYLGLKISADLCRLLGQRGCKLLLTPIVLYFFASGREQREASREFLTRALGRAPTLREEWRHFMNFAMRALHVFQAWTGKLPQSLMKPENPDAFADLSGQKSGCLMVVAHIGNADVVRALADKNIQDRLTILVHSRNAVHYNRIIQENSGDYARNFIQVTEIGPETIITLKERLDAGGIIVIAGDRTPVLSRGRSLRAPFFGHAAAFPEGPWLLAALLECPVYLMHCPFEAGSYRPRLTRFADRIILPRKNRQAGLQDSITRYAAELEKAAAEVPLQWYNFYHFWGKA